MSLPLLPTREAILQLLQSADEADRKQALIELIRSQDPLALSLLEKLAAEDPSVEVRYFARRALSSFKAPEAPPPAVSVPSAPPPLSLFEPLQSSDTRLRLRTLRDLPRFPVSETLPAICRSLVKESDPRWQSRFLATLGRLQTPDAIDCILPYLQNRNTRVRANAAEALGAIGTREALRPLVPLLADDDNRVKANVIHALHSIGSRELLELLRSLAQDGQIWMRDSALYALSRLQLPEARGILEQISRSDPSERLRQKAAALLGEPVSLVGTSPTPPLVQASPLSVPPTVLAGESPAPVPIPAAPSIPPIPPLEVSVWSQPQAALRAMLLWQNVSAGSAPSLEVLTAGLRRETEELPLTLLLSLIRQFPHADLLADLLPHLDSRHPRIRANAVEALQATHADRALTHLYPILEDMNNRVRANAILALSHEPLFPALPHIRAMAQDPRETWRLSALYVLLQKPRSDGIPLLNDLLDDQSERVRDAAHQVLLKYRADQISGLGELVEKVETRLKISKTPGDFFENSFDHVFSGLIRVVSSGEEQPADGQPRPDSDRIRQHLLELGRKALTENLLGDEFSRNTALLKESSQQFLAAADRLSTLSPPESAADLSQSVARASQAEWLRQKSTRFQERYDLLLIQGGTALARNPQQLEPMAAVALESQLQGVVTLGDHLPSAGTSVLPGTDAPVAEIFDLTMRLYQKHVVGISLLSIIHAATLVGLVFLGLTMLFAAGIKPDELSDFAGLLKGEEKLKAVSFGLWVFLSGFFTYASFKSHLIIFLREYIRGGKLRYPSMIFQALTWLPRVVWVQARKSLYLFGWLLLAGLAAAMIESFFGPEAKKSVVRGAIKDLSATVVAAIVFGYGFLAYTMAESLAILGRPSDPEDPLVHSRRLAAPWIFKLFLLCSFSLLLVQFITSATQELLMLGTFFNAAEQYAPLVRKAVSTVAILSQLCLSPLLLANLVIFSLMLLRETQSPGRS